MKETLLKKLAELADQEQQAWANLNFIMGQKALCEELLKGTNEQQPDNGPDVERTGRISSRKTG